MSKIRQKYDVDFKKNAVKLSYATSKTTKDFAADLGVGVGFIYNWRKIYTEEDHKTKIEQNDTLLLKMVYFSTRIWSASQLTNTKITVEK